MGKAVVDRRTALTAVSAGMVAFSAAEGSDRSPNAIRDGIIDVAQFGARYDGRTDSRRALQAAIDACSRHKPWRALSISGPIYISGPVFIDRPVDKSHGIFLITGVGSGEINAPDGSIIFESRLDGDIPTSEYLNFERLTVGGRGTFLLSGKFLRVQIDNCQFIRSNIIGSAEYIQSLDVNGSRFIGESGSPIISAKAGYNIVIRSCNFESTGCILSIGSVSGIVISSSVFEGCRETAIRIEGANGFYFHGNYTEQNRLPTICLGVNSGKSRGIAFIGNNFKGGVSASAHSFEVELGNAEGVYSGGNYCSGNLYNNRLISQGGVNSIGDFAAGNILSYK